MSEALSHVDDGAQAWRAQDRVDPYLRVALAMSFADHDVTLSGMTLTFELLPGVPIHALADALEANDRVRSHWQGEHAVFGLSLIHISEPTRRS